MILDHRDRALDGITGLCQVTHRSGGTVNYVGATPLRPATADETATMKVLSTWRSARSRRRNRHSGWRYQEPGPVLRGDSLRSAGRSASRLPYSSGSANPPVG